ncbi:MAG: 50S ribosomal protein L11 methyltransferase [Methanobacteriaceae archaeon]|nr:50S ribosomal protein L11 methyltransferase [Methanobacteriaceae archaeon]
MDIKCKCNNDCIKKSISLLKNIDYFYFPCDKCQKWNFKKFKPLLEQLDPAQKINADWGRCSCGRRHLDVVIAHILNIMQEDGLKDERSTLRETCVPLITPAYPLNSAPYLDEDTLVILSPEISRECAERIVSQVPEVKGVLKGDIKDTVGIKNSESSPHTYQLLAGCDLRLDIVQTPFGAIYICKNQGDIHIEFPKPVSPKIIRLKKVLGKYEHPSVLDCTCGPGTLGIAALKGGAKRVVFNDIWYPAARTTALNLEVNGFPLNLTGNKQGLIAQGEYGEVYCLDVLKLGSVLNDKFDLCLVDTFPGVDTKNFENAIKHLCQEVVII